MAWLTDHLENNPGALAHSGEGETFVVTAATKQLRDFVAEHTDEAFEQTVILELD